MTKLSAIPVAAVFALIVATTTLGAEPNPGLVTTGSPSSPFSQNKQNEPALAVDANHSNILVAGANENIDMEACNAGNDTTCPFTPGVGVSGVYFSFDSGKSWSQPTYTGLTARGCLGVVGNTDPGCTPTTGPIGTLPWYAENGLVSGGDPALAFGPKPGANGAFSWTNGSRLYYANLAANLGATRSEEVFKGFEALAVSRTDDVAMASTSTAAGKAAWMPPVLVAHQSSTTFSDKEQICADNASSSPFFGNVSTSSNGGGTWSAPRAVAGPVTQPGIFDPVLGRPTIDGIAGARSDLAPAPSVDIANGAPTGADATNRIVMTYVSGAITKPHVYFTESTDKAKTWSTPRAIEGSTDRGYYTAPSISPDGTSVYVVYDAFTTPYQTTTATTRSLVGVFLRASSSTNSGTPTGAFSEIKRG